MNSEPTRILVVDDETGIREGCRRILESEGFSVETAEDGLAGLERFRAAGPFALALVDLKMPRMDGLELIGKLRADDEDLAILIITAYATIETAVEATKRGAQSYVAKPFTPDELMLHVRNALERRALALEARRLREEREKRLLELGVERSQSSTVIRCMSDGVVVVNADRQVVLTNEAAARAVPKLADVEVPAPLDALDSPPLSDLLAESLGGGAGPRVATREMALGDRFYMATSSPVADAQGETIGAAVVLRDITELKKQDRAKTMFISLVSHEVKRPLSAIESLIEVILSPRTHLDDARKTDLLQRALQRAESLRMMVNELMNLNAIETGNFSLTRVQMELGEALDAGLDHCRERAQEKGIELLHDPAARPADAVVLGDKEALTIVLSNLIDNAVKYTPEGGHVRVTMAEKGHHIEVSVQDDGIGIRQEDVPRLFDEFFRATNKFTSRVTGTGLGLSLVKRLVEMHQGGVSVESQQGEGSVFIVRLPRLEKGQQRRQAT